MSTGALTYRFEVPLMAGTFSHVEVRAWLAYGIECGAFTHIDVEQVDLRMQEPAHPHHQWAMVTDPALDKLITDALHRHCSAEMEAACLADHEQSDRRAA